MSGSGLGAVDSEPLGYADLAVRRFCATGPTEFCVEHLLRARGCTWVMVVFDHTSPVEGPIDLKDEKLEAERGAVSSLRSLRDRVAKLGFEPGLVPSRVCVSN